MDAVRADGMTGNRKILYRILPAIIVLLILLPLAGCIGWGSEKVELQFSSYSGGGPEYSIELKNPGLVSVLKERVYHKSNHDNLNGAGYTDVYTLSGLTPGSTILTVTETFKSEVTLTEYLVTVNDKLDVTIEVIEDQP